MTRMTSKLAVDVADGRRPPRRQANIQGCRVHSDRGSQGGFNWSSQHCLDLEVCDGTSSAECGSRDRAGSGRRGIQFQRHVEVAFWEQIAKGLLAEEAAAVIGVAQAVGARWFHKAGGMPPFDIKQQHSGRYLSFPEREEIALRLNMRFNIF